MHVHVFCGLGFPVRIGIGCQFGRHFGFLLGSSLECARIGCLEGDSLVSLWVILGGIRGWRFLAAGSDVYGRLSVGERRLQQHG